MSKRHCNWHVVSQPFSVVGNVIKFDMRKNIIFVMEHDVEYTANISLHLLWVKTNTFDTYIVVVSKFIDFKAKQEYINVRIRERYSNNP